MRLLVSLCHYFNQVGCKTMTTNVAMLYLCWFNSFLTDKSAVHSFDGYVIVNTPQAAVGCMEYNARVCNHKYREHFTPYSPAWGVLTGL